MDYGARLWLSGNRRTFVRRHILDLAVIVLPLLRPLRLLRLIAEVAQLRQAVAEQNPAGGKVPGTGP